MKFSLKAEYGLRALIDLALCDGQGPVVAKEIAARQRIPERFLEQQLTALAKAGLVTNQRGASGGCSMARAPDRISVLQVIEALEGPIMNMDCLGAREDACSQDLCCVVQELWQKSQLKMREFLGSVTIADLAQRQRQLQETASVM